MDNISENDGDDNSLSKSLNTSLNNSVESDDFNQKLSNRADGSSSSKVPATFKNALQAKKRLQAFSLLKQNSLSNLSPLNKKTTKLMDVNEKDDSPKKSHKKEAKSRAKTVIEEIEELKREEEEIARAEAEYVQINAMKVMSYQLKRSSSRSPDSEKNFFKRREIKSRNYRKTQLTKRSPTPEYRIKKPSYPENWTDFKKYDFSFSKIHELHDKKYPTKNAHDLIDHLRFETNLQLLQPYRIKSNNGGDAFIPAGHIRYTTSNPEITYSVNPEAIKESHFSRKQVFTYTRKHFKDIALKLIDNPAPIKFKSTKKLGLRNWYPKTWKRADKSDCKVLESSLGLSFLQTYSDNEEEDEEGEVVDISLDQIESESAEKLNECNFEKTSSSKKLKSIQEKESCMLSKETPELHNKFLKDKTLSKESKFKEKNEEKEQLESIKNKEKCELEKNCSAKVKSKRLETKDKEDLKQRTEVHKNEEKKCGPKKGHEEDIDDCKESKKKRHRSKSENIDKESINKSSKKPKVESRNAEDIQRELLEIDTKIKEHNKRMKEKKLGECETEEDNESQENNKKYKAKKKQKYKKKEKSSETEDEDSADSDKKHKRNKDNISKKDKKVKSRDKKKRRSKSLESSKDKIKKRDKTNESDSHKSRKKKTNKKSRSKSSDSSKHKNDSDSETKRKKKINKKEKTKDDSYDVSETEDFQLEKSIDREISSSNRESTVPVEVNDKTEVTSDDKHQITETPKKTNKNLSEIQIANNSAEPLIQPEKSKNTINKKGLVKSGEKCDSPDTDEYHSHWESEDEFSSLNEKTEKHNRSWESDEELFNRNSNKWNPNIPTIADLEIPLEIKKFSKRKSRWDREESELLINKSLCLSESSPNPDEHRKIEELETERMKQIESERKLNKLPIIRPNLYKQSVSDVSNDWENDDSFDKIVKIKLEKGLVKSGGRTSTPNIEFDLSKVKKEIPEDRGYDNYDNSLLRLSSTEITSVENIPVKSKALENEYEEFIKAVGSDISTKTKGSSSEKVLSDGLSFVTDSSKKKSDDAKVVINRVKQITHDIVKDLDDLLVQPQEIPVITSKLDKIEAQDVSLPKVVVTGGAPIPVPSTVEIPGENSFTRCIPSVLKVLTDHATTADENESDDINTRKRPFFTSMSIPNKRVLLDNSELASKLDDDDDHLTERLPLTRNLDSLDAEPEEQIGTSEKELENIKERQKTKSIRRNKNISADDKSKTSKVRKSRSRSPSNRYKDGYSIRDYEKDRHRTSKREMSPKRSHRNLSPISRRRRSPRRYSPRRSLSPRHRSRRSPSPRSKRSVSPRRRDYSPRSRRIGRDRSRSFERKDKPPRSPLRGPKRSVADSTISDDLLPQVDIVEEYNQSPDYFTNKYTMPLDERINRVLNMGKEEPTPINTTYDNFNYSSQHSYYDLYGNFVQYNPACNLPIKPNYEIPSQSQIVPQKITQAVPKASSFPVEQPSNRVLQVGNVLQVIPTELPPAVDFHSTFKPQDAPNPTTQLNNLAPAPESSILQENISEVTTQINSVVRYNQLPPPPPPQSPSVSSKSSPLVQSPLLGMPMPPPPMSTEIAQPLSAEIVLQSKNAERRAERDKRRWEREARRLEKQKKKKEKEKERQLRLKLKTENMIKKALLLETEIDGTVKDDTLENEETFWPPVPIIVTNSSKPPGKSILITGGSGDTTIKRDGKKCVSFADGIFPGEGTSPSGGEELGSPPPVTLPKEKRYKKIKVPKKQPKKKIKVKVVKKSSLPPSVDEDSDEDNLPPPSPPPGSPPPHIFPPRIKTHTINNLQPSYVPTNIVSITRPQLDLSHPPPLQTNFSTNFRSLQPVVIHTHGLPMSGHGGGINHNQGHGGGMNPNISNHGGGMNPNISGHGGGINPNMSGHGGGTNPNMSGHGGGTNPNMSGHGGGMSTPDSGINQGMSGGVFPPGPGTHGHGGGAAFPNQPDMGSYPHHRHF